MFLRALSGAGYYDESLSTAVNPTRHPVLNITDVPPETPSNDRDTIVNRLARLKEDIANAVWECPPDADGSDSRLAVPARGALPACLKPLRKVMRARENLLKGTNVRVAKEETALHAPPLLFSSTRHARSTREVKDAKRGAQVDAGADSREEGEDRLEDKDRPEVELAQDVGDVERVLDGHEEAGRGQAKVAEETKKNEGNADERFDRPLRRVVGRAHR